MLGQFSSVVIPIRMLLRPGFASAAAGSTGIGGLANRNGIDGTLTGAEVKVTLSGVSMYDDFDFGADKVALIVGDSILNGTTGITRKDFSTEWLIRQYFRENGARVRLVSKAISGTTSGDHERLRSFGNYDLPQVNLIIYMLGTNDAGGGVATATFKANVEAAIEWKQQTFPSAAMLVIGSPPRENNTFEAALALMRTAASQAVTAADDDKVLFIDLTDCFDRTSGTAVYASTDTPGDRVHPNDTGHAAMFAAIEAALDAADLVF